jgi:hypothetical protein
MTALVLAAALLWHSACAGFSATTAVQALPTITSGALVLTDDDTAARMFAVTGLKPGATATKCIAVTSSGSPATVRLYGTGRGGASGLPNWLNIAVSVGTGGSTKNCTGFSAAAKVYDGTLAAFPTGGWVSGVGSWTATGTAATSRTYQIVYTLPANTPYTTQNGTATLSFVWESRTAS